MKKDHGFILVDNSKISVRMVKFLDIESDRFGRDVMTFEYKGRILKSYIYGE
jgi:hypothetical protein